MSSEPAPIAATEVSRSPPAEKSALIRSLQDIGAGTVGGWTTVLVGHPLDTIKVRMQAGGDATQTTMMSCIRETIRREGVRGFYKGMQSPLAGEGFFNACQFWAYGTSKAWLLDRRRQQQTNTSVELTEGDYFIAGALTGAASSFVECPIDLFKSQLQTQIFRTQPLFRTFPECMSYVWRHGGIRGVYQGLSGTLLRTTPASAAYFGSYEATKTALLKPGQSRSDLPSTSLLLAGGVGGVSYWASSFPLDSIKRLVR